MNTDPDDAVVGHATDRAGALARLQSPRMHPPTVIPTDRGLYCPPADLHIDPWRPVDRAIVTHAHADHLHPTSKRILVSEEGEGPTRIRASGSARIETAPFGEAIDVRGVRFSLHPAGHIRGSAQVRVEHRGHITVVTGDYKRAAEREDPTATPFEPVPCHRLITESTFGLPIFRWPDPIRTVCAMIDWWRAAIAEERNAILFTYALGKSQRLLALIHRITSGDPPGPILLHGAMAPLTEAYQRDAVAIPEWEKVSVENAERCKGRALIIAPPSAGGTPWIRKLKPFTDATASGWAQVRGTRRRRAIDRGFVISDHADWPSLLRTIEESGAESVGVTHGYTDPLARYLNERGLDADVVPTRYEGEADDADGTERAA